MNYVIDLIIIAIIILMAVISAKRGFVRAAVEVTGFIAAIILATTISQPLADFTYHKVIEPPIISSVGNISNNSATETVNNTWDALPDFVKNNADKLGISKTELDQNITQSATENAQDIAKKISSDVVKPVAVNVLKILFSVVIMVVLIFVVKILAKLLNKMFSFSVVGKVNSALGGVLGILKGIIIAWIFCLIVYLIISFTDNGIWIFNNENTQNTVIFKFLVNLIHI